MSGEDHEELSQMGLLQVARKSIDRSRIARALSGFTCPGLTPLAVLAVWFACTPPSDDTGGGGGGGGTAANGGGHSGGGTGAGGSHTGGGTGGGGAVVNCNGVQDTAHLACGSPDQPGGLCHDNACQPCADTTDDAACAAAYGLPTICVQGECVPGSCHASTDCAGKLCLIPVHLCASCTANIQCPGQRCDTASGKCVAATCTGEGTACAAGSLCCQGTCVLGNCCDQTACGAKSCTNHLCTTCSDEVELCVDPDGGDDTLTASCCFKTLTRALESVPNTDGGVVVLHGDIHAGAGEAFPLHVPVSFVVTSDSTPRTVFPAATYGFELGESGAGLSHLTVSGGGGGVRVLAGTSIAFNSLDDVTLMNASDDGIRVEAGGIAFNGQATQNRNGLHVLGGTARMAPTTAASAHFDGNLQHGMFVELGGAVILEGDSSDGGNLTANGNGGSGLQILNVVGQVPPFQRLIGLVATGNTLDGMRIGANANLSEVRNNILLGNHRAGVSVRDFSGNGSGVNLDGTNGPNTFQSTTNPNLGAGLCFDTFTVTSVTVNASHNRFGTADCSIDAGAGNAPALKTSRTCTGAVDVGGVTQPDGGGGQNPAHATLDYCQSL